jgi:hypothetical protein
MNKILDLIDFERRGEYVLADVKSATWFFECFNRVNFPDALARWMKFNL